MLKWVWQEVELLESCFVAVLVFDGEKESVVTFVGKPIKFERSVSEGVVDDIHSVNDSFW